MRNESANPRLATQGREAARGAASLFVAQFTLMLSSYVVVLALARALGPELYGAYGIVYSFLLSIELIGRLGLPQALSKLIADARTSAPVLEATGFTLAAIVYATIFAGFWLAAPALGTLFHVADGARLFRIAAIDIPFYGVYFICNHILTGRRLFHAASLGTVVYGLSKAAGILILVQIGPSVAGALVVNAIGSIVALAVVVPFVGRAPLRLTLAQRRPIIRLAVPVALIALGTQTVISIDLWVLNAVGTAVDDAIKGLYVAAVNVARIPNFLSFVMTAVLVPTIAAALAANDHEAARSYLGGAMRFMAVALIPGCTLIAINAPEVLALLFSADYAPGADLLVVLIFAHGLCFTTFLSLANVLIGAGRATTAACLSLVALAFAAALSVTLVLWAGALGAAWAALIANAAALVGASLVVGRVVAVPVGASILARVLLLTALIGGASWWIEGRGPMLLVELALLGLVYVALLPVAGLLGRTDVEPFLPEWAKRAG
ncbi:MAG: oligosaccharide flippase family protein [Geminicoccaceae bacterium]